MTKPRQPLFLERETYRHRRVTDAARLLPILGFLALCLPILWADERLTSNGMLYLLGVWIALMVAARMLARRLHKTDVKNKTQEPDQSG
jgi:hypothetical protein